MILVVVKAPNTGVFEKNGLSFSLPENLKATL